MTSDAKRYEGDQEEGLSVMTATQPSVLETAFLSPAIEEDLSGLLTPQPAPIESLVRPAVSVGYIPIHVNAPTGAGEPADPRSVKAFENLERDLDDLATVCSGLSPVEPGCAGSIEPLAITAAEASACSVVDEAEAGAILLDSLQMPANRYDAECNVADVAIVSPVDRPAFHFSNEESSTMNAQAQPAGSGVANAQASVESAVSVRQSSSLETDGVLHDVQSTLDSLAGMAHGLSQQKLEIVKMREALEERRLAALERERQLVEREERLSQQEQRLQEEKHGIERIAEHNAAVLAERSSALQTLAETVDSRDRATTKRAEVLSQEQQSIDRQLNQLRARVQELDDREVGLQRQGAELSDRFKQLLDAKERFGAIVKGFNETVRFNTTYSAISKTVGAGAEEA
ncbi:MULTISPECIES: hypothetical protein [Pseudomonas]|uniref:hypothetical protein n=1 Tax=Pseudomonas nitroreducens TaxID=46680 RepID=UPI001E51656B|nr:MULTISPECIES: hypothetical protein [Pseudomonas]MCE4070913.1 hypothetical protein [Pseudomonas nitritireducens]MCE4080217.1 hypothetical protein [Pseudomonas nitroreducens]